MFVPSLKALRLETAYIFVCFSILLLYFYIDYAYAELLKRYFYAPIIKYGSSFLWQHPFLVFAGVVCLYFYRTVIRKHYIFDMSRTATEDNLGSRIIERRNVKARIDVIDFSMENAYDRRYLVKPLGLLEVKRARSQYLLKAFKINTKIKLVKFFFDMEFASSFRGVFNWWFLNWQVFFSICAYSTIFVFLFFICWFKSNIILAAALA